MKMRYMMKRTHLLLVLMAGVIVVAAVAAAGQMAGDPKPIAVTDAKPDWEIPIAAGVWYPQNGPLPDKPMRYYRVRCWPGCHSGSSLGMYPKKLLVSDRPIHATSTIDNLPPGHPPLKKSHGKGY